jgi:hypothetical protein
MYLIYIQLSLTLRPSGPGIMLGLTTFAAGIVELA